VQADNTLSRPTKRCHNCNLACNGMFCCEWCINTYLARQDAHRVSRRSCARSQPIEGSAPEVGHQAAALSPDHEFNGNSDRLVARRRRQR